MLACGSAPASSRAQWDQLRQALSGAKLERGYTGALALVTVTREQVELCTATLLTPNLVATARHCVAPTSTDTVVCSEDLGSFSAPHPASSLWVNRSSALSDSLGSFGLLAVTGGSDEFVAVADVYVPDTARVCGGDLALLILDTELDAGEATPLAPRLDTPVERGESYTAVGFGDTPAASEQGTRRSRSGLEVNCTADDCDANAGVEATEFRGGDGVCSGDSGGPAIDAAGRVVGIASRSDGCTNSVYSAVSSWSDFIREVAARATRAGSYPDPEWLVPSPPEPPKSEAPASDASALASPDAGAAPEPAPEPVEDESNAEGDLTVRPVASSSAGGGSGCSVGLERRAPHSPLFEIGLGMLALALARRRKPLRS